MPDITGHQLSQQQSEELIGKLKSRFEKNMIRHENIQWHKVEEKLRFDSRKLWSLNEMERTGGEPDVIGPDDSGELFYYDCSSESPKGRRSLCYDRDALNSRKEYKPANSVLDLAEQIGIELLSEDQYRLLQQVGKFDEKSSSWIKTPDRIRKAGGALFCDRRYDTVFTYHNGAESYYALRGFRGRLKI